MYFIESYLKTSACTLKYFDTFFFANLVFSLRNTCMRESNFLSPSYSNHSFQPPSAISSHPLVSISASTPFTPLCPRPRHVLYPSLASRCYFINDPLLFSISLSHFSTPFFFFKPPPPSFPPPPLPLSLLALHSGVSRAANHYPQSQAPNLFIFYTLTLSLKTSLSFFSLLSFFLLLPARLVPWGPVNQAILPVQCLLTLNTADGGLLTD